MDKIVFTVTTGKATISSGRRDDDLADRLSSRYTPLILIVFTLIVTIQQLVRNPITCWAPVHFTDSHTKYANQYCWIRNTYYLPFEDNIPYEGEYRQMLKYYQYIQFLFLGQAAFFYLPTMVWRAFNSKAGVDADNILHTAVGIQDIKKAEKRDDTVRFVSSLIDRFLESRQVGEDRCQCDLKHILSGLLCRCCGRRVGNYLVMLYMFQKLLFIVNIVLQFVALGMILGDQFYLYGAQVVAEPIPDHQWTARGFVAFPRVTLCDFKVRRLGNIHRYTLQCVLPLNLYIEKMYVFLWFWMVFVLVVSLAYFAIWSMRFTCRKDRVNFVTNHLTETGRLNCDEALASVGQFVDGYLRQDGVFLLRLIATNTNHVSTGDIISGLWDFWCDKTDRTFDPAESDYDDPETQVIVPEPRSQGCLTCRRKKKPEAERPKPADLSRAPTLYVRGGVPPSTGSYPEGTPGESTGVQEPTPQSSSGSLPEKSAIPLEDINVGEEDKPAADRHNVSLYPQITEHAHPVPQPRMPTAPLADVKDTEV